MMLFRSQQKLKKVINGPHNNKLMAHRLVSLKIGVLGKPRLSLEEAL